MTVNNLIKALEVEAFSTLCWHLKRGRVSLVWFPANVEIVFVLARSLWNTALRGYQSSSSWKLPTMVSLFRGISRRRRFPLSRLKGLPPARARETGFPFKVLAL